MFSLFLGNRGPSLQDTIAVGGVPFNLTGSTVIFKMRLKTSAALKVSTLATIVNPPGVDGKVRYDWAAGDVDTPGEYVGWWSVTLPNGSIQETSEFDIEILTHTPDASLAQNTSLLQLRGRLKMFTDADAEPVLSDTDLDLLIAKSRRVDLFGNPPDLYDEWAPQLVVALGGQIVPTGKRGDPYIPIVRNGFYYIATVAGVTGAIEPAWPVVVGATIADGTVTWTCTGTAPWNPAYDLYYAVAQGWLVKAGRLAGHYNFMTGGKMLSRQQFYDHCIDQYKLYGRKSGLKALRLGGHSVLGQDSGGTVPTNADG